MASSATAPAGAPAFWRAGTSEVRKAHRATPSPALAADGSGEAVAGLAEAAVVDAAGDGLPACGETVASLPQAAVSRLTASTSAQVGRFMSPPVALEMGRPIIPGPGAAHLAGTLSG